MSFYNKHEVTQFTFLRKKIKELDLYSCPDGGSGINMAHNRFGRKLFELWICSNGPYSREVPKIWPNYISLERHFSTWVYNSPVRSGVSYKRSIISWNYMQISTCLGILSTFLERVFMAFNLLISHKQLTDWIISKWSNITAKKASTFLQCKISSLCKSVMNTWVCQTY